jgi:tetratricopeptide (TPR) repeat protein
MEALPIIADLWDYADLPGSEARFNELLPRAEAHDPVYALILRTQIARTYSLRGDFPVAHKILDGVAAGMTPEMALVRVRYLLERGRCFNSAGEKGTARPLFLEAYELGRTIGPRADYHTIDAAHMLGIAAESLAEQQKWNETGINLAEASAAPRAQSWLGPLYNNTGWNYAVAEMLDEALAIFQRSWAWRQAHSQDAPQTIRIAKWCVAHIWRRQGQLHGALALLRELEAAWAAAGSGDGYVFEDLAECLAGLGEVAAARPYYTRAHTLLSADGWLVENEPARLQRLQKLGQADG